MIQPGQIYRSLDPRDELYGEGPRRIKVVGKPMTIPGVWGFGKVQIATLREDGTETRRRRISIDQLHDSPTTRDGQPRRTGYALEQP
ncbi:hypothetical protein [Streptomyces spinosus]|uniref:hypothetical protein n=1 Tax=Streptomyces spinosus TaxID=2872623 RepID=UPI001CED242C|nr:hypothetical protein [Streptomyces spinosus]